MNAMVYADLLGLRSKIETEVARKWEVNTHRTWKFVNGVYKHVGKDGNEWLWINLKKTLDIASVKYYIFVILDFYAQNVIQLQKM